MHVFKQQKGGGDTAKGGGRYIVAHTTVQQVRWHRHSLGIGVFRHDVAAVLE